MSVVLSVAVSFTWWVMLYSAFRIISPSTPGIWHVRAVTVVHAVTVCFLSAWCLLVQGPWVFTDPGGQNTPLQNITLSLCLAYFLFDFLWCIYYKTEGPFMLFHHMLSLFGNTCGLYFNLYGTELCATIFGTEITNPLLQLRWYLRKTGRGNTWLAEVNDAGFMALFGAMRIVLGGHLLYSYMLHPKPDWLGRFGGISMYLVSWGFWVMIVRYAVKKYFRMWKHGRSREEKHVNGSNGDVKNHNHVKGSL